MIEQLKALEEYLRANKMDATIQSLRAEVLGKYSQGPSTQFLGMVDEAGSKKLGRSMDFTNRPGDSKQNRPGDSKQNPPDELKQKGLKGKKDELVVEGLLGKIAYSTKLLEDSNVNSKISKLINNRIFLKAVESMFPEVDKPASNANHSFDFKDELDYVDASNANSDSMYPANNNGLSQIEINQEGSSILSQPSLILEQLSQGDTEADDYTDDNDLGYYEYSFSEHELISGCQRLQQKYGYPDKAVRRNSKKEISTKKQGRKTEGISKFPAGIQFPPSEDALYPLEYNGVIYDTVTLQVIFDREKTGYEERRELEVEAGELLGGRYRVESVLGSGVFAKVLKVFDTIGQEWTCLKMIANNKDFFDQALDEIKILRYIAANCDPDQHHLLRFKGVFYHREHLFIETDLLKDNLYIAYRKNPTFFSIPILKQIARQILLALHALHSLQIMHADLKPENILIKSYNPVVVKVVDLGNSCFFHDSLQEYVQSRSYRAPEVALGTGYDEKIDIWSVGCIMAELWTKNILFYNTHVQGMLARIQGIVGPWPEWMLDKGHQVENYFSKENLIFIEEGPHFHILIPKPTTLQARVRTDDQAFLSFLEATLKIDPNFRPSAQEALQHPFIADSLEL